LTKRDKKQKEIVDIVVSKAKELDHIHHSIVVGTGVGKSKIAMDIIQQLNFLKFKKILIVVDNIRLRDHNWEEDFTKWGLKELYDTKVEMNTYQTVFKWSKPLDDYFIICDEMDFAFTDIYGNFYKTYKDNLMLGFTGFVTANKRPFMDEHIPCLVEYTAEQAQHDGILNSTPIVFIKYDLSKKRDILVKYKKGSKEFYTSENSSYNYWDGQVRTLMGKIATAERKALISGNTEEVDQLKSRLKWAGIKRSEILLNLDSSVNLTRRLLNYIQEDSGKTVIFSKRRSQCDKITPHTYHGGNPELVNNNRFNDFNSGKIKELGLVDKINRGVNMVNLNYAVFESYVGSDTKLRQRIGRMMRLDPEDFATIYILLPYFMREVKVKGKKSYTQAKTKMVDWAETMLQDWDLSRSKVWDYRTIKSNL
jgi:superfamily II DNA or RNA helicase